MNTPLRPLRSIHTLPYATLDQRIVARPGYDEKTHIYLELPLDYSPNIPTAPPGEEVRKALVTLAAPWSGYSWSSPDDAAAMLSGVLASVFRPVMRLCPGYVIDANTQGSGKTLAATALGCLLTGRMVGVVAGGCEGSGSEEEQAKRLLSCVVDQQGFICFDNLTGHYRSAALAGCLTSGRLMGRVLGLSRMIDAEANMLITATGNNCSFDADLLRRMVRCRIDGGANPTAKRFAFTPPQAALQDRLKIAEACCVLLAAYWAAGAPQIAKGGCGGFDEWVALCRQPLLWASAQGLTDVLGWGALGDPAGSLLADSSLNDPDIEALGDLLRSLEALSDGRFFTSKEVQTWYRMGADMPHGDGACTGLYESVREMLGSRGNGEVSSKSLGRVLLNRRDRVVHGLRLVASSGGVSRSWKIVHAAA